MCFLPQRPRRRSALHGGHSDISTLNAEVSRGHIPYPRSHISHLNISDFRFLNCHIERSRDVRSLIWQRVFLRSKKIKVRSIVFFTTAATAALRFARRTQRYFYPKCRSVEGSYPISHIPYLTFEYF